MKATIPGTNSRSFFKIVIVFFPEPILEDLEMPHRYRPENLKILCEATG
jgi:hypothetical protein